MDAHRNFAYATVLTPPSPALSGLTLTLVGAQGALLPVAPFNMTVWPVAQQPLATNAEIVRVTSVVGDVLNLLRAQEGSAARAIQAGDQIAATITAKTLADVFAAAEAPLQFAATPASDAQGHGPAVIDYQELLFATTLDPTLVWGYNLGANGGVVRASDPGLAWAIEADFDDGTGDRKMESYLQWRAANDVGGAIRPISFQLVRDTGVVTGCSILAPDIRLFSPTGLTGLRVSEGYLSFYTQNFDGSYPATIALSHSGDAALFTLSFGETANCLRFSTETADLAAISVAGQAMMFLNKPSWGGVAVSVGGVWDNSALFLADNKNSAANGIASLVRGNTNQSVDVWGIEARQNAVRQVRVNKDGGFILKMNNAVGDGDLAAGEVQLWLDQTNGAAKLKIKAKQADGAVRTAEVALA